jgi:hypothetical protein
MMKESYTHYTTLVSATVIDSEAILRLLLEVHIRSVLGLLMTIIVLALRRRLRPTLRDFFRYVNLKKKRVGYSSVINFEGQLGSRSQEICDLFVRFMKQTYANELWVPLNPGLDDVSDEPPLESLQIFVLEVLNGQ